MLDLWQRETEDSPMELIFLLTCTVLLCEAYGVKSADIRNEKERVNLMFTSSACGLALIIALSAEQYWVTYQMWVYP